MMPNQKNWDGKTLKAGSTIKIPSVAVMEEVITM
jgi:hypothetical protein